jgi:hypothetical protein
MAERLGASQEGLGSMELVSSFIVGLMVSKGLCKGTVTLHKTDCCAVALPMDGVD